MDTNDCNLLEGVSSAKTMSQKAISCGWLLVVANECDWVGTLARCCIDSWTVTNNGLHQTCLYWFVVNGIQGEAL